MTTLVTVATNTTSFPNGSVAVGVTTSQSNGAVPPVYTGVATAITITKGPNGELPPGYPAAFPGAIVQ